MAKSKSNENEEILPTSVDDLFDEEDTHDLVSIFVVEEREGSLSPDEIQRFKSHLSTCETCSKKYSVLTGLLGTLESKAENTRRIQPGSGTKAAAHG